MKENLTEEEFNLIDEYTKLKIKELSTFRRVRYEGGRAIYEINKIARFINSGKFNINFVNALLKNIKDEIIRNDVKIYDYFPSEDLDVTDDFMALIEEELIKIKHREINRPSIISKFPDYCSLGVLVVIKKEIKKVGSEYHYKDQVFNSSSELEKYLRKTKEVSTKSIRQYLDDSYGAGSNKSLFAKNRVKKIIEYCVSEGIEIPENIRKEHP